MTRNGLALALATVLCLGACSDDSTEPPLQPPAGSDLECVRLGYPCSLADTSPERLDAAIDLLDGAWAQRHAGTMAETRAWLEQQPEVIEVVGDDRALRFRIAGCPPVWLVDDTGAAGPVPRGGEKSIVGDDTNDDGLVDNRDRKRALLLAPYTWQFQPNDETELLAGQLESVRGYAENVTFKSNPDTTDQNIELEDFLHWDDHDLVYVATHGKRLYDPGSDNSWIVISTGVFWDQTITPDLSLPGVIVLGQYDGEESRRFAQLGLTPDFFRSVYPAGLDQAMVVMAVCETGGLEGSDLANALAGEDFVMFGWTETVESADAFPAMSLLMERLGQGQRAEHALEAVEQAGLASITNADGLVTELEHFVINGNDQRLFELPQLLDDAGDVLEDGVDFTARVVGTVGDGNDDSLALTVEVDGVTAADMATFVLRYRFDGDDLDGEFDLAGAEPTGSFRYRIDHVVDLGRDVEPGSSAPLEVVVDLPEGGQSRFRVDVEFGEPGGGDAHDCDEYVPTPVGSAVAGTLADRFDWASASFSGPSDPGGGYWTVTATTADPVNTRLVIRSGEGPATIFSESNQGTAMPHSITAAFEGAPGWGYTAEVRQAVVAPAEAYPINWTLQWNFTSVVDCYEPNQSAAQAKRLPRNIDGVTAYMVAGHRGNSLDAGDYDDWYQLDVTEPSDLTVNLYQSPSDIRIRLRLWGSSNNQLASAGGNGPGDPALLSYQAQPGTYFLSVEAAAIGDGAVNTLFDAVPPHFVSPYVMNVSTEPLR